LPLFAEMPLVSDLRRSGGGRPISDNKIKAVDLTIYGSQIPGETQLLESDR